MCGIHFSITNDSYSSRVDDFLSDAFLANQVRGLHSSGIFQVSKEGTISTFKRAVPASDFLMEQQAKSLLTASTRSRLTVGHVRHATAGAIVDKNAHPFRIERDDKSALVGVHNGTLKDWRYKVGGRDATVDSEWAMQMIADEGADAFEYFDGAYAMIWYDSREPDYVFMARNEQRPLHFFLTEDGKTMLGASELGMLGWLAERNQFKARPQDKGGAMFWLSPGKIYKFSLKEVGKYETFNTPEYNAATGVQHTPSNFSQGSGNYSYNNGHYAYVSERRQQAMDGYGMYEDDGLYDDSDWGEYGVMATGGTTSYMDQKLDGVKAALAEARKEREEGGTAEEEEEESVVIDAETLDNNFAEGLQLAVEDFEAKRRANDTSSIWSRLLSNPQFSAAPNDKSATKEEIDRAKDMRIYGQIVEFEGDIYEEDSALLLGRFSIKDERGNAVQYDGEMRFATARDGYEYIDSKAPVTIVGFTDKKLGGYRAAVVIALPSGVMRLVKNKLSRQVPVEMTNPNTRH